MTEVTVLGHFSDDNLHSDEPTKINSDQPLEAGCYWKATGKSPAPEGIDEKESGYDYFKAREIKKVWAGSYYEVGEVLLLERIDWVDNAAHTVYLLMHPKHQSYNSSSLTSFKMLVNDFVTYFVPEHYGEQVRNQELLEAQGAVNKLQQEFIALQSNPEKFQEAVLGVVSENGK